MFVKKIAAAALGAGLVSGAAHAQVEIQWWHSMQGALNDKVNETVVCEVKSYPESTFIRKVELLAVGRQGIKTLMYDRWVAANAKKVSDMSGGKLGYIHIPTMDEQGLDRFIRSLYSDNFDPPPSAYPGVTVPEPASFPGDVRFVHPV